MVESEQGEYTAAGQKEEETTKQLLIFAAIREEPRSVKDLVRHLNVSVNTVRSAVAVLRKRGYIKTVHRPDLYVVSDELREPVDQRGRWRRAKQQRADDGKSAA